MKVKRESEIARLCLTLGDPMDCRLPGSSVHGIFQARVLEWGTIAFSSNALESPQDHPSRVLPPRVCEKIIFHETGPWCQKDAGSRGVYMKLY